MTVDPINYASRRAPIAGGWNERIRYIYSILIQPLMESAPEFNVWTISKNEKIFRKWLLDSVLFVEEDYRKLSATVKWRYVRDEKRKGEITELADQYRMTFESQKQIRIKTSGLIVAEARESCSSAVG